METGLKFVLALLFILGTIYYFIKSIKTKSTFSTFIAVNSINAGFGIIKEFIPNNYIKHFNILRIILCLIVLAPAFYNFKTKIFKMTIFKK